MTKPVIRFSTLDSTLGVRSATWRCWANEGKDQSVYIACRELRNALHLSLHESGQWHVAFAHELFPALFEDGQHPSSRFIGKWTEPSSPDGIVLACRIHTPWFAVSSHNDNKSKKICWLSAPMQSYMRETCICLSNATVPGPLWQGAVGTDSEVVGEFQLTNMRQVQVLSHIIPLAVPNTPKTSQGRFFKGKSLKDLEPGGSRMILIGDSPDGAIAFFETLVLLPGEAITTKRN